MSIKTIIIPFSSYEGKDSLSAALSLTKKHNAHLEVLHVTPDSNDGLQIITDFDSENKRMQESAHAIFNKTADEIEVDITEEEEIVDYPSATFVSVEGKPDKVLPVRARLADLVVMSGVVEKNDAAYRNLVHAALFRTGRPVLLIPPAKYKRQTVQENVIIAWDGSFEAARAVNLAIPLLRDSKVFVFTGVEKETFPLSNKNLVLYLQRHGISAEAAAHELHDATPETAIREIIQEMDAGMLVMGAYSREDKMRETLLGSLTHEMLDYSEIPILMAN
ncbi:MAG: universal stress protein [bacterium]|nr:universal stress protein [bacterium]